jgi:hydrogenase maturation protein HypF
MSRCLAKSRRNQGCTARVRATIEGRVQGVGFRPAIYRHAVACRLAGFVRNDPGGVTLEVEGHEEDISTFFRLLEQNVPERALIVKVDAQTLPIEGYKSFEVVASQTEGMVAVQLPPDLATCDTCLSELGDPTDRRYRYPFINCVDCGPRFTIIRDLPYDRANTSMVRFPLCPTCGQEYADPGDRRFHAEPNACPACGPRLTLIGPQGASVAEAEPALREAQALLRKGGIVAVKGLGGYHLACDAFDKQAIARLRDRKQRPHKTFAVMFRDIALAQKHFPITPDEATELLSAERPIVVLDGQLDPAISPDTCDTGVFLPYTPVHKLLLEEFEALVLTSGNRLEEPIAQDEEQVASLITEGIADAALTHDRPIQHRCDDSVVRFVDGRRRFLRRARGFVPTPLRLGADSPVVLATGGDLKSTFCLIVRGNAHVSQHVGDLAEHATHTFFEEEIRRWLELLRVNPQIVAHDLHPGYLSTRYASRLDGVSLIGVQHHHAHIAGVMAECGLEGSVLGIALDGTGYGTDGTVWGGEFLLADRSDFERLAHLRPYPLPGGERAIDQPWRMAVSVCVADDIDLPRALHGVPRIPLAWVGDGRAETVSRLIESRLNCPLASSAGRLFDAAAALLGLCDNAGYEAQGAIRLEAAAAAGVRESYPFELHTGEGPWVLDLGPAFRALVGEIREGCDDGVISAKFHNAVVAGTAAAAVRLCAERAVSDVVLSGGVFQNRLVLNGLTAALRGEGLVVHANTLTPCNDGGLSLGQAAVALARIQAGSRPGGPPQRGAPCA